MNPSPVNIDPLGYYSAETLLFPKLQQCFAETGDLDPEALYLILDWKAPRARTRHLKRLAKIAGSFGAAAHEIAAELHVAAGPEQRPELLLTKWEFLLPTASALLVVLYPETFTMYDIRVCDALIADKLGDFRKLGCTKWSANVWEEYETFVAAVRRAAREGSGKELCLRECDRWLWGRDKQEAMRAEIAGTGRDTAAHG